MSPNLRACLGVAMSLAVAGCVTINIYFPAAAAEKAADRIIDEVWQLHEDRKAPSTIAPAVPSGTPGQGAKP